MPPSSLITGAAAAAAAATLYVIRRRARSVASLANPEGATDPHAWLEDVTGGRALRWVREHNARTLERFGDPKASSTYSRILAILDSKDKIPYAFKIGGTHYYNFWQDSDNERGLWRRCTLAEYAKEDPEWETVLDVDALARREDENWVWKGYTVLDEGPGKPRGRRCLVKLSRGGADATVIKEFDLVAKRFIPAGDGGFYLPEAKSRVSYKSRDVVLVGTDDGSKGSLTSSGYPRTAREWTRGTALKDAPIVFEGKPDDVAASAYFYHDREGARRDFAEHFFFFRSSALPALPQQAPTVRTLIPAECFCGCLIDRWRTSGARARSRSTRASTTCA